MRVLRCGDGTVLFFVWEDWFPRIRNQEGSDFRLALTVRHSLLPKHDRGKTAYSIPDSPRLLTN
jgi:hypothetical protein